LALFKVFLAQISFYLFVFSNLVGETANTVYGTDVSSA